MKRKFIHDVFLDKENLLMQNIIANSKEGNRRKLKSIDSDKAKMCEVRSKSRDRYRNTEEQQQFNDSIQFTFGDWKSQIRVLKKNTQRQSVRLNSLDTIKKTINTEQEQKQKQKSNQRVKKYEEERIKQIEQQKINRNKPLCQIQNIIQRMDDRELKTKKKIRSQDINHKHALVQKKYKIQNQQFIVQNPRGIQKELHQNFQTIDLDAHKIMNRNLVFKRLYIKQKQKYEQILKKYNIEEQVDHTQFFTYFKS